MVGAQHGPVSGQVLKVIHDDSDEQIDNLSEKDTQRIDIPANLVSGHKCTLAQESKGIHKSFEGPSKIFFLFFIKTAIRHPQY